MTGASCHSWRWQMAHATTTGQGIPAAVTGRFPFFATPYARALAARSPAFAKQVFPDPRELAVEKGIGPDPYHETGRAAKCYGLKQRFPDRVLVMTSATCAMNCRHCTRKGLLGSAAQVVRTPAELAACVRYVKAHPRVRDVLLSGGDPLVLADDRVMAFVDAFAALPQIEVVRLCTRMVSTLPMRLTPALVRRLAASKKVWVNTQFNCADELTPESRAACARLVDAGIPVSCQTVLLKGVNDSVPKMFALLTALQRARVRPYYVFQCDPVAGIAHFRVPLAKARAIERALACRLGGLALPRFVADLPGAARKIPLAELLPEARS